MWWYPCSSSALILYPYKTNMLWEVQVFGGSCDVTVGEAEFHHLMRNSDVEKSYYPLWWMDKRGWNWAVARAGLLDTVVSISRVALPKAGMAITGSHGCNSGWWNRHLNTKLVKIKIQVHRFHALLWPQAWTQTELLLETDAVCSFSLTSICSRDPLVVFGKRLWGVFCTELLV